MMIETQLFADFDHSPSLLFSYLKPILLLSPSPSSLQALNEGELNSHKLDEIWSSFGAELTEVTLVARTCNIAAVADMFVYLLMCACLNIHHILIMIYTVFFLILSSEK